MWPQIFVNYKMKSVAHLPWRALTYKILSTFVDDLFAWIINGKSLLLRGLIDADSLCVAPLIHKLATLRDDVVFFVYLYQRWVYRVDKSRINEFGQRGSDHDDQIEDEKQKSD